MDRYRRPDVRVPLISPLPADLTLRAAPAPDAAALARRAAWTGADGVHFTETSGDPFIACALACEECEAPRVGTAIALATPRSPMDVAYSAWDLQRLSGGRFTLGLGTQVRAHIERRYGMRWSHPAPRMAEFTRALRAIWASWQGEGELDFVGDFYRHDLMPPNFNPGPLASGPPPVLLAGVRPRMLETIGEVADGLLGHSLQTPAVIAEHTIPALERGLEKAGRERADLEIGQGVFVAVNEERWESIRRRIAFYGSTPGYRHVLDHHGLGDLFERLHDLSRSGGWKEMAELVDDEVVELFAVRADDPAAGAAEIERRYGGLVDRIGLDAGDPCEPEEWAPLLAELNGGPG